MFTKVSGLKLYAALSLTLLCLAGLESALFAQTVAIAEVSGLVSDQSGGAVGGAIVCMTETDKQTVHTVTTDNLGRYVMPNLPVGPYRLQVQAKGFKDYVATGIELTVGNNIQINATLQVGSVNETVEVQATTSLVETKE